MVTRLNVARSASLSVCARDSGRHECYLVPKKVCAQRISVERISWAPETVSGRPNPEGGDAPAAALG